MKKGLSLIETLVGVALMLIIFVGLLGAFRLAVSVVGASRARVGAVALANERMELIRNLPYEDIGTIGGIPAGEIASSEELILNQINYTIRTLIQYVDDIADGEGVGDENGIVADYKKVKIEIGWGGRVPGEPVILISNIVPDGMETDVGGGTLKLSVFDASVQPVISADVHIENNEVFPPISVDVFTNSEGKIVFPGTPTASAYEVSVSKPGFSSVQTYDVSPQNPNPQPGHFTILEGQTTEASFSIDLLSDLRISTLVASTSTTTPFVAKPDVNFSMRGEKVIGDDLGDPPNLIYKYSGNLDTGESGSVLIEGLEWDNYWITIDGVLTGYDISESCPFQPVSIVPNTSDNEVTLILENKTTHSLLVYVEDIDGEFVTMANVRLNRIGYDETQQTSDTCGQTFFSGLSASTNYAVEVSKSGYESFVLGNVEVDGYTTLKVILSSL